MRYARLFLGILTISVQRELAFRTDLVFQALRTAIELSAGLAALALVYSRTNALGGWGPSETLVVLGCFTIMSGVLQAFLEPNLAFFAETVVREGKLDDLLLRPVPNVLLASLGACQPWALAQVLFGCGVTVVALNRSTGAPGIGRLASSLLLFVAGLAILWATRVLLAALAFWAPHFAPDVLYDAFWQLGRYPVTVYPEGVVRLLTFVFPIALIVMFPAQALVRGVPPVLITVAPLIAVSAIAVTAVVWSAGLRRYSSATS